MRKLSYLMMVLVLGACQQGEPVQLARASTPPLQCGRDTDCKVERICEAGACTASEAGPQGVAPVPMPIQAPKRNSRSEMDLESRMVAALQQKPGTLERLGAADAVIGAYAAAGYVAMQPDWRADYSDYRVLKQPASLLGHTMLMIEHESMQTYIGCCVSPGLEIILRLAQDGEDLQAFASGNGCRLKSDADRDFSSADLGLDEAPEGTYAALSCKERDIDERG
ncbi:MAG: hypothetical protein ABW205_09680 [Burkholderiales bacterium]